MAYSAATKAEAVSDVITGKRTRAQVCRDLSCSSFTLNEWLKRAKGILGEQPAKPNENQTTLESETTRKPNKTKRSEPQDFDPEEEGDRDEVETDYTPTVVSGPPNKQAFEESLYGFVLEANEMGRSIARTCSDPKFIRKKPSAVNELARTVFEQRDRLVSFIRSATGQDPASPDTDAGSAS